MIGSVRSATHDDGLNANYYDYDVFGKPFGNTSDYGYVGKPYDPVTGLSNYGYRDYSPKTARFTTVDPIRDGHNWYAYCSNDPVNFVDLWGLSAGDPKHTKEAGKHDNLTGLERLKAEVKDCFGFSFSVGLAVKGTASFGAVKGNVGIDLGSQTTSQDKNGRRTEDTAGLSVGLDVLGLGNVGLNASKKAESTESDEFVDVLKNAWNAELEVDLDAEIDLKGASVTGKDSDLTVGVGGQIGVGFEAWVNITEGIDLLKFIGESIVENIQELLK